MSSEQKNNESDGKVTGEWIQMKWKDDYQKKFISAEEAANIVQSGDSVVFTMGREAFAVGLALAARKAELKNVRVFVPTPGYDFGWYDEGWRDSFDISIVMPTATCQEAFDRKRLDMEIGTVLSMYRKNFLVPAEVAITEVSEPDEKGFCSFGQSLWNKKAQLKMAKTVVAEVNKRLIRTYGENFIHVSEIDYFVEHASSGSRIDKPGSIPASPRSRVRLPMILVARLSELRVVSSIRSASE